MKEVGFQPITLQALKDCFKELSFDVYLHMPNGKFLKAFEKSTGLDFIRLANYEMKGVQYFYIRDEDSDRVKEFLSQSPMLALTNPSWPIEVKKRAFFAVVEQTLCEAFSVGNLSPYNITKSFETLKANLQYDADFVTSLAMLLKTSSHGDWLIRHAISTAVYSYVAAYSSGLTSERTMKILVFASLFHDLGKLRLPPGRRLRYQNVSDEERVEFQKHPLMTLEVFASTLPFADEEIKTCIAQHRERLDGQGYPHGLKGRAIFSLARILAVGDGFSDLTLGLEDGRTLSRQEAIAKMLGEEGRYDKKILLPFAHYLLLRASNSQKAA